MVPVGLSCTGIVETTSTPKNLSILCLSHFHRDSTDTIRPYCLFATVLTAAALLRAAAFRASYPSIPWSSRDGLVTCSGRYNGLKMKATIGGDSYELVDEGCVIRELMTPSQEFRAFYDSERRKIETPVRWALDSGLPKGVDYMARRYDNGEQLILLRKIPELPDEAFPIAHELQHLLMDREGFISMCAVRPREETYEAMAVAVNGMTQDPVANARLRVFGFDLKKAYEGLASSGRKDFGALNVADPDRIMWLQWVFQTVEFMLEYQVAFGTWPDKRWVKTIKRSRYPDLITDVGELTGFMLRAGLETPGKQRAVVHNIIAKYALGDMLLAKSRTPGGSWAPSTPTG
ncbi:MAG: hypothetical protein HW414_1770 [Dehalococcoidia bacterium]|nr:hypothetical protein [Dehalococcoidia bacterium]